MDRREELNTILERFDENKKMLLSELVNEIFFLEMQLKDLKKYPFIKVHPKDSSIQKQTVAGKQYKELLQQYNNCIKVLLSSLSIGQNEENDSVVRQWMKDWSSRRT